MHRTSGAIFALQMETAGLAEKLKDLIDIVYVNAPNPASGPLPPDVPKDVFPGPYYEWWNAQQARGPLQITERKRMLFTTCSCFLVIVLQIKAGECILQDPITKEVIRYEGYDDSMAFLKDYIALHGPFDGLLGFSQAGLSAK